VRSARRRRPRAARSAPARGCVRPPASPGCAVRSARERRGRGVRERWGRSVVNVVDVHVLRHRRRTGDAGSSSAGAIAERSCCRAGAQAPLRRRPGWIWPGARARGCGGSRLFGRGRAGRRRDKRGVRPPAGSARRLRALTAQEHLGHRALAVELIKAAGQVPKAPRRAPGARLAPGGDAPRRSHALRHTTRRRRDDARLGRLQDPRHGRPQRGGRRAEYGARRKRVARALRHWPEQRIALPLRVRAHLRRFPRRERSRRNFCKFVPSALRLGNS